jgi:hypothetical protein
MQWQTEINVPMFHQRLGCPSVLHAVLFAPNNDRGGECDTVTIEIPEGEHALSYACKHATALSARVIAMCNTRAQADAVADHFSRHLRNHHRISLERARAGAWGRLI